MSKRPLQPGQTVRCATTINDGSPRWMRIHRGQTGMVIDVWHRDGEPASRFLVRWDGPLALHTTHRQGDKRLAAVGEPVMLVD